MENPRDCGLLIKQISDELRKNANNALRPQDMTLAQLDVLVELDRAPDGKRSLKELEQILHVAQSTAAGIIARLEQKGFAEGFGDAGDRRVKLVRITPAGIECVRSALHHRAEAEERLLSDLTETERDIFYTLLKKVRASL
ncbi:MAG: MarR family transcriptional regulator [Provencibacterium sp.]|jgi:DNA-binding MarR family transcriptional regulator|nr:MarR family transcriptional regulator [Provencibacterium sp.]